MTEDKTQKIKEKLDFIKETRQDSLDALEQDSIPDKNVPGTHRMIGNNSRILAIYHLELGACESARAEFRTATIHYGSVEQMTREEGELPDRNDPIRLRNLLHMALLSGDKKLVEDAAKVTLELSSAFVDQYPTALYHYYYVLALAAELQNTGAQGHYLDRLDNAIDDIDPDHVEDDLHVLYRAWWRTLSGIVSRDHQMVAEGLSGILDHHERFSSSDSTKSDDLVCVSGAALLVLARRQGLDIRMESGFIPDCVYEVQ